MSEFNRRQGLLSIDHFIEVLGEVYLLFEESGKDQLSKTSTQWMKVKKSIDSGYAYEVPIHYFFLGLKLYEITERKSYLRDCIRILNSKLTLSDSTASGNSILNGRAGLTLGLLCISTHRRRNESSTERLSSTVLKIIQEVIISKNGVSWDFNHSEINSFIGLSYGSSGVGNLFLLLSQLFQDKEFSQIALESIHTENSFYLERTGNWLTNKRVIDSYSSEIKARDGFLENPDDRGLTHEKIGFYEGTLGVLVSRLISVFLFQRIGGMVPWFLKKDIVRSLSYFIKVFDQKKAELSKKEAALLSILIDKIHLRNRFGNKKILIDIKTDSESVKDLYQIQKKVTFDIFQAFGLSTDLNSKESLMQEAVFTRTILHAFFPRFILFVNQTFPDFLEKYLRDKPLNRFKLPDLIAYLKNFISLLERYPRFELYKDLFNLETKIALFVYDAPIISQHLFIKKYFNHKLVESLLALDENQLGNVRFWLNKDVVVIDSCWDWRIKDSKSDVTLNIFRNLQIASGDHKTLISRTYQPWRFDQLYIEGFEEVLLLFKDSLSFNEVASALIDSLDTKASKKRVLLIRERLLELIIRSIQNDILVCDKDFLSE